MRLDRFTSSESDFEFVSLVDTIEAAFCPTGPGGGIDNSCSSRDGSQAVPEFKQINDKLQDLYKQQALIKAKAADERKASGGSATSATKKLRSQINKQIDEQKAKLVALKKKLDQEPPGQALPAPEEPKGPTVAFGGKHTDSPIFKSQYEATNWLQKEYNLTLQTEGKIKPDRITALAQVSGEHLAYMSNNFELLDRYRTEPDKIGQPGGYGTHTVPYRSSGNFRITTAFAHSSTGGDYNPNTGTIRMKDSLKIYGKTYAPRLGDHNVDFSYAGCFRHEYGHRIWGLALTNADRKEMGELYSKYGGGPGKMDKIWSSSQKIAPQGAKAVSVYGMTNVREFWAESFCAVTSPAYNDAKKKLPEDIESFMHRVLGKRSMALAQLEIAPGVFIETAFCPTGPGGGIDNSCSSREGSVGTADTQELKNKLDYWVKNRDLAVQKIKEIKATGTTKGLSTWKNARKNANAKIKELQAQISGKFVYPGTAPKTPSPTPAAPKELPVSGAKLPFYKVGSGGKEVVWATTLKEAQKQGNVKAWDPKNPLPDGTTVQSFDVGGKSYVAKSYQDAVFSHNKEIDEQKAAQKEAQASGTDFADGKGEPVPGSGVERPKQSDMINTYDSWVSSLDSGERGSIKSYTASLYDTLNNGFRKNQFSAANLEHVHNIDDGLAKAPPVEKDILLYRHVGSSFAKEFSELKAGDVFVERGYVSTTINKREPGSGKVTLIIKTPAGAKGAYVETISHYSHEREFIMPRDTMFKVHRVIDHPGGNRTLFVEVVVGKKKK